MPKEINFKGRILVANPQVRQELRNLDSCRIIAIRESNSFFSSLNLNKTQIVSCNIKHKGMTNAGEQAPSGMRSSRIDCSLSSEYLLVQENILLQNERITQLYVIQSEQNPFLWFGILFVDTGIYQGVVIRFNMYIEDTYPDCPCPKIVYNPIPYHPLVNPMTGELDTKNAFPEWNSNSRKIYELLLFVKRVIRQADEYIVRVRDLIYQSIEKINDESDSASNQHEAISTRNNSSGLEIDNDIPRSQHTMVIETDSNEKNPDLNSPNAASKFKREGHRWSDNLENYFTWLHHSLDFIETYENNKDEFSQRIEEFKEKCAEQLFDRPALCGDDINALVFTPWNMDVHEPIRRSILSGRFATSSLFAAYHKETDSVSFIPGHSNNY